MSVEALVRSAARTLRDAGVEEPRNEARALLGEALGLSKSTLMAHPDTRVPPSAQTRYQLMVERRAAREPFAYVVGHREFYGLDFEVSPAVLIPRPETEMLVEEALRSVEWIHSARQPRIAAADIGTGSGAIAVSLAVHTKDVHIFAVDMSSSALDVARRNAARHSVSDRIVFRQGHLLNPIPETVDLLLANLPYVPAEEVARLMPEVSAYEPLSALEGGADGTELIREALEQVASRGVVPYVMLFELGHGQGTDLAQFARELLPEADVRVYKDYAGLERLLSIRRTMGRSNG